jgi:hypothetical protein
MRDIPPPRRSDRITTPGELAVSTVGARFDATRDVLREMRAFGIKTKLVAHDGEADVAVAMRLPYVVRVTERGSVQLLTPTGVDARLWAEWHWGHGALIGKCIATMVLN